MQTAIRFKQMWRSRPVGSEDRELGYGMHDILVQRGIAEFIPDVLVIESPALPECQPEIVSEAAQAMEHERTVREPRRRRYSKESEQ